MSGFQIFYEYSKSQLKCKNDLLVATIHWLCIQAGFRCLGIGEKFEDELGDGSELLPQEWNDSSDAYILRYVKDKEKKLLVKFVKVGDTLIVSALLIPGENTDSSMTFNTNQYISDSFSDDSKSAFLPDAFDKLSRSFKKEVLEKLNENRRGDANVRNDRERDGENRSSPTSSDPLRIGPPHRPNYRGYDWESQGHFPPRVGGADLDPLGSGMGGGMLMDPRQFPRPFPSGNPYSGLPRPLPPGAIPPGARFDPFGPGGGPRNPTRYPNPDPDHLPPPGYDDMFM